MKKILAELICIFLIVTMYFTLCDAQDWPMFHHDLALSGYTDSDAPETGHVLWTYQTGGSVESSPAIVGDKVYIGSQDGNLYCLNKYTGTPIWNYQTSGMVQSSPAVSGGKVYFLSTDGTIYALNADNGAYIWHVSIGSGFWWDWSSPAVHDGNVLVASSTGGLYSLDANTGTENWNTLIGFAPNSPITVVNGKVYSGTHNFSNSSPTMVALNESNGSIAWTYDYYLYHAGIEGMVNCNGAAVLDGDEDGNLEVYFGVYNIGSGIDDQAVCLDEATGTELWTYDLNGHSTSTPAVHDGKVFIGSDDGKLYALDASDGSYIWSYQTGGEIWSAPAVSGDGKVCFGSWDHTVYCLEEDTGNYVWSYFTGSSRVTSSPAISDGILIVGNENGKVYAFGPTETKVDLYISDVNPIQVIWDADVNSDGKIDLVSGKKAMVRIFIEIENVDLLDKDEEIEIKLAYKDIWITIARTGWDLISQNFVEFYFTPTGTGVQSIVVEIDPENEIDEADETNNIKPVEITVTETEGLDILYVKVNSSWPADYGPPDPEVFQNTVEKSTEFIQTVYPIPDQRVISDIYYKELKGNSLKTCFKLPFGLMGCPSMKLDIRKLAKISIKEGYDRAVGVVSDEYFSWHKACLCDSMCFLGAAFPGIQNASIVEAGYYIATAHETGHNYGLPLGQREEYKVDSDKCTITYRGNPASGFWVEKMEEIENSICFMGASPPKETMDSWIGTSCYFHLFSQLKKDRVSSQVLFQLKKDTDYNPILLIDGDISVDGSIQLGKWYYLEEEEISVPSSGDYSINLIDKNGRIVQEVKFDLSFFMYTEPFGVIETESAPFVFTIPYPENISQIQIQHNGETLIELNPNEKLLHDAIDSIPNHGFVKNPAQRSKTLHNKINAVEKMLDKNNFHGAVQKLENDIKDKIEKWLVDDYEVDNPLQMTKDEVLNLIEEIIERLRLNL